MIHTNAVGLLQIDVGALILEYGMEALGLVLLGLLLYWWFLEARMEDDEEEVTYADRVDRVGQRATTLTGGVVGAVGSLILAIVAVLQAIGTELGATAMQIWPLVSAAPAITGQFVIGVLALLNVAGYVPMKPWQLGTVILAIIVATVGAEMMWGSLTHRVRKARAGGRAS